MAYRLSLPARALRYDKIQKDDANSRPLRFSTVNLGKGLARQRANISCAFSSIWDKGENHKDGPSSANASAMIPGSLASRMENSKPPHDPEDRHAYKNQYTTTEETEQTPSCDTWRVPFIDQGLLRVGTPFSAGFQEFSPCASPELKSPKITCPLDAAERQLCLPPNFSSYPKSVNIGGPLSNLKSQVNPTPPSFSDSRPPNPNVGSPILAPNPQLILMPQEDPSEDVVSFLDLNHMRSASSFYPSEGIRSDECTSPVPNTSRGRNFSLSSVSQYLKRSHIAWLRSTCRTDDSAEDRNIELTLQEELAAAGGIADAGSATTDDMNPKDSREYLGGTNKAGEEGRDSSSTEAATSGIVESGAKIVQSTRSLLNSSSDSYTAHKASHMKSTVPLSSNTGSEETDASTVRGTSLSDPSLTCTQPPLLYHHCPISCPSTTESSLSSLEQLELQTTLKPPSVTLAQQVRKLKLRKWVKKVCRTTKVRFRQVMKPRIGVGRKEDQRAKLVHKRKVGRFLSGSRKRKSGARKPKKSKKKNDRQHPLSIRQDLDFRKLGVLFWAKKPDVGKAKESGRRQEQHEISS